MAPPYNQMMQFEPLRIYDSPGVLAARAIDGDLNFQTIRNVLISPQRLTPTERESLGARLKSGYGGDPVSDTLIGMATDPFVWMMFLTSAPGAVALKGGKRIFSTSPRLSAFVKEKGGFLQSMKMLTGQQAVRGTHLVEGLNDFSTSLNKIREERILLRSETEALFLKSVGAESMDYDHLTGPMKEKMERWMAARAARVGGYEVDRDIMSQTLVPEFYRREWVRDEASDAGGSWVVNKISGKTIAESEAMFLDQKKLLGDWEMQRTQHRELLAKLKDEHARAAPGDRGAIASRMMQVETKLKKQYTTPPFELMTVNDTVSELAYKQYALGTVEQTNAILDEVPGLRALVDKDLEINKRMWSLLTKDEKGNYDRNKIFNLARGLSKGDVGSNMDSLLGEFGRGQQGKAVLEAMLSQENLRAVDLGLISVDDYGERLIRAMTGSVDNTYYLPLNTIEEVAVKGKTLNRETLSREMEGSILSSGGRVLGKTWQKPIFHPKDLDAFEKAYGPSEALKQARRETMDRAEWAAKPENGSRAVGAYRLNPTKVLDRYYKETEEAIVLHTQAPSRAVIDAQRETLPAARQRMEVERNKKLEEIELDVGRHHRSLKDPLSRGLPLTRAYDEALESEIPGFATRWEDGFTRADALRQGVQLIPDPHVQRQVMTSVLPAIMGRARPEALGTLSAMWNMKQGLQAFTESGLGKWMEQQGVWGPKLMARFREMADPNVELPKGYSVSGSIARFLYTTHLGLNLGSVTLNATQPMLLTAPMLGMGATMKGYASALGEMWSYASDRVSRYGLRPISHSQRRDLILKHFKYAEQSDIGADFLKTLDSAVFGGKMRKNPGKLALIEEFMMKGFEKSEWLNRTTTAHAVAHAYKSAGRTLDERGLREMARFVGETQFGSNPLNTPELFLSTPFFSNPLMKQFLTFPLRSFTAVAHTMPALGGQDSYGRGLLTTVVRGMGISALTYEAGKGALGADLSRGLFFEATTDLLGGERLVEDNQEWLRIPPVADIPRDFLVGMGKGDMDLVRESLARSVPGGVSIARMLTSLPTLPGPASHLQRTTAAWDAKTPDGMVPVFKGESLVDFRSPVDLVTKALGVDLSRMRYAGELDGYLVKQRDEILGYRHQYMAAVGANNFAKAAQIKAEFERRVKTPDGQPIPLTVNAKQWQAFLHNKETPRTERILDRLPPEVRPAYAAMLGTDRLGGGQISGGTSRSRERAPSLTPSQMEAIKRAMRESDMPGSTRETGFSSYGSF
jgi:hypothetical protein